MIQPAVRMVWLSGVAASQLQNSLKPAPIITSWLLLLFGRHQGVTQFLTARQRHFQQEPASIAVAKRRIAEHRVIAGLQRTFGPARARQNPRTRDFEHPRLRRLAIPGVALDDERDMGVGPVDGLDRPFHGLGMFKVVSGIGMVRRRSAARSQHQAHSKSSDLRRHRKHPYFAFLFRHVKRAVWALRVWNEDIVAELVLAGNQIFLSAFAFRNLIVPFWIAPEYLSRLP